LEFTTFLWTTLAAFLTLAIFSFLYKDNPFYKFAEHLVVGVSAGYFVIILWHNTLVPNLFQRLAAGNWWYLIPLILGLMMWSRFFKNASWLSRIPLALYIGIAAGLAVPLEMSNRVLKQVYATMVPINWGNFFGDRYLDIAAGYSQLLLFVGTIAGLVYFFFSKAHTGAMGTLARLGLWILMLGFGASFGFTVMARISLLINRIQFIDKNWIKAAFNESNANYSVWFQIVFYTVILLLLVYIIKEIITHMRLKTANEV